MRADKQDDKQDASLVPLMMRARHLFARCTSLFFPRSPIAAQATKLHFALDAGRRGATDTPRYCLTSTTPTPAAVRARNLRVLRCNRSVLTDRFPRLLDLCGACTGAAEKMFGVFPTAVTPACSDRRQN